MPEQLHFLRPEWLWLLIPALVMFAMLRAQQAAGSNWARAIDPALLPLLLDTINERSASRPLWLLPIAWSLAVFALAGPVWEKIPRILHEREDAVVILLDLSLSMYATDVRPSRLVRARHKIADLLETRTEGMTGLIAYAGDAHTVSPLTDDSKTINALLPVLTPALMPRSGSRLAPALNLAHNLLVDAGMESGRILVVTDEIRDQAAAQTMAENWRGAFPVSILGVGTVDGAPIPQPGAGQGYLKHPSTGELVIARMPTADMLRFAGLAGGRFSQLTIDDGDLAYLMAEIPLLEDQFHQTEREFDVWFEEGPWLILLLIPIAALAFRRGWIWCVAIVLIGTGQDTYANPWDDLWQTREQQALERYEADPLAAAELFDDPDWKGAASYRGGDFAAAAGQFANIDTSNGRYNLGNALARQGRYQEAIDAYDNALARDASNEDATFNRKLVEDLLNQEQEQQQNQESSDSDEQQDQEQSADQQSGEQEGAESDQQQSAEPQQGEKDEQQPEQVEQQTADDGEELDTEEEQALQQWLRRVPDDPGGLLREKFRRQHADRSKRGILGGSRESGGATAIW
jgi:Ca-activated chloride channel family protein